MASSLRSTGRSNTSAPLVIIWCSPRMQSDGGPDISERGTESRSSPQQGSVPSSFRAARRRRLSATAGALACRSRVPSTRGRPRANARSQGHRCPRPRHPSRAVRPGKCVRRYAHGPSSGSWGDAARRASSHSYRDCGDVLSDRCRSDRGAGRLRGGLRHVGEGCGGASRALRASGGRSGRRPRSGRGGAGRSLARARPAFRKPGPTAASARR